MLILREDALEEVPSLLAFKEHLHRSAKLFLYALHIRLGYVDPFRHHIKVLEILSVSLRVTLANCQRPFLRL